MKIFKTICVAAALLMGVCASQAQELRFNSNHKFKIVQFTDIHWISDNPASEEAGERMREVLDAERPDLVVFTGDVIFAKPAAVTHSCVYFNTAVLAARHCRASDLHTSAAFFTRIRINLANVREFLTLEQHAGRLGYNDCKLVSENTFFDYTLKLSNVKGIYLYYVLDADRTAKLCKIDSVGILTFKRFSGSSVLLMSRHTRGAVIKDHNSAGRLIVYHIDK